METDVSDRALGRAAAELVDDGDAVALDSTPAAYHLALALRGRRDLLVVTNALPVATALAGAPGVTVVVSGGRVRALSVVGELAAAAVRVDKGFFGARGIDRDRGLLDAGDDEVLVKRRLAAACDHVIGMLGGTQWQRTALVPFVPPDRIERIVTDGAAPAELVREWRERGVAVVTADARQPAPA
jgi:DeoR/GlpR family transcriptional regulator of sugar metabolism